MPNVGIGTTSPAAKLDVSGDVHVSGARAILRDGSGWYVAGAGPISASPGNGTIGIGAGALASEAGASYSTALGSGAASAATFPTGITAIGYRSLYASTSASNSTAVGYEALLTATGGNNTAIGQGSGGNVTTGANNTFVGRGSGLASATQRTNATAIGYGALVDADNALVLGNSSVNVGIGTSTPGEKLAVSGAISIGTSANTGDGTIRWTGTDFEGRKAGAWVSMTGAGSGLSGSGTTGNLPKFTAASTLGDSLLSESGSSILAAGSISVANNFELPASSSTAGHLKINGTSFLHGFGTNGTFVGSGAGNFTHSASDNTAMGASALAASTTGSYNSALGAGALQSNTSGAVNTAVGHQALRDNDSGNFNTAVGAGAMKLNVSATYNVAVGSNSFGDITTGSGNVGVGDDAGRGTQSGSNNVYVGEESGKASTAGSNNTYLGALSGRWATGSNNVFIGYTAGSNEAGSNKLYIANATSTTPLIHGDFAAGNIGIGTIAGGERLAVSGAISIGNAAGTGDGTIRWTGADFEGRKAGAWVSLTNGGLGSGDISQYGNAFGAAITIGSNDNFNFSIETNNIPRVTVDTNGNLGIGTTTPALLLEVLSTSTTYRGFNLGLIANTSVGSPIYIKRARGTPSSPTAMADNDYVGGMVTNVQSTTTSVVSTAGMLFYVDGTVAAGSVPTDLLLFTKATGASNPYSDAGVNRVILNSAGNFGIGDMTPGEKLAVSGAISIGNAAGTGDGTIRWTGADFEGRKAGAWVSLTSGGGGDFMSNGSVSMSGPMRLPDGTVSAPSLTFGSDTDTGIFAASADTLAFATLGTERMRITSNGRISFGNSNPQSKFVLSNSGAEGIEMHPGGAAGVDIFLAYNRSGSTYDQVRYMAAAHRFEIGASEMMRIHTNGNVGIGNTNPGQKLDVTGNVRVSGAILGGVSANADALSALTVDVTNSNTIRADGSSAACGTLNITNTTSGGQYTVTIKNATASCTTIQWNGSATNVKLPAGYSGGSAVSGVVYTFLDDGATLWVSYVGF